MKLVLVLALLCVAVYEVTPLANRRWPRPGPAGIIPPTFPGPIGMFPRPTPGPIGMVRLGSDILARDIVENDDEILDEAEFMKNINKRDFEELTEAFDDDDTDEGKKFEKFKD